MHLTPSNGRGLTAAEVKAAAEGRWIEILVGAGIPESHLDGKGHSCPICGGDDRFAAFPDVNERGAVNCRVCDTKCGDGLATLRWLFGCEFQEALRFAASCVGLAPELGVWSPPIVRKIRSSSGAPGTPETSSKPATGNQAGKRPPTIYGTPGDAEAAILRMEPTWRSNGAWDYLDADGKLLFTIVRFDLPDLDEKGKPKKEFRPLVVCEGGFKIGGVPKSGRPLYGLPWLKDAPLVFVCEGEKACGALQRLGLVAVTSPFGAKSPGKTDWSPLTGRIVVLIPDNDDAGEVYLAKVAAILTKLPDPPTVRVLRLPDLPEGGDAHDWLEELDSKEPDDLKKELLRMADEAKEYEAPIQTVAMRAGGVPAPLSDACRIGPAGEFLRLVMPQTEGDEAAILLQFLACVGNCAGRTAYFEISGERHYTNLYVAIVGTSSKARKGTSWGFVGKIMRMVEEPWTLRIRDGLTSGEGLIDAVKDDRYEKRPIREGGRSSGKILEYQEELVEEGVADKRLLALESEFGRTLTVAKRDQNTLFAVLRVAWDGKPLGSMARNNRSVATGAHISLVGHITDEELHALFSKVDLANGVGNRIIWIKAKRSKLLPFGGKVDDAALLSIARRISEALEKARQRVGEMPFDTEAGARWEALYGDISRERSGPVGCVLSRAEPQVRRIATIYALLDGCGEVRTEHLNAALEVWRYACDSAESIFAASRTRSKQDRILDAVREQPGLSRTDLHTVLQRNVDAETIRAMVERLESQKLIRCERGTGHDGQKNVERYYPLDSHVSA